MRKLAALMIVASSVAGCKSIGPVNIPLPGMKMSDEEAVAAVLDDVEKGIETRRIFRVLAHVSQAYHDQDGRDYEALRSTLTDFFKKYRAIRITRVPPRIVVQGDRARALETFGAVAEALNPNEDSPVNLQGQVTIHLQKVGGAWQIVEWERVY